MNGIVLLLLPSKNPVYQAEVQKLGLSSAEKVSHLQFALVTNATISLDRHCRLLSAVTTHDGCQTKDRCINPEENVVLFIRAREGAGSILRRSLHDIFEINTLRFRFASSNRRC